MHFEKSCTAEYSALHCLTLVRTCARPLKGYARPQKLVYCVHVYYAYVQCFGRTCVSYASAYARSQPRRQLSLPRIATLATAPSLPPPPALDPLPSPNGMACCVRTAPAGRVSRQRQMARKEMAGINMQQHERRAGRSGAAAKKPGRCRALWTRTQIVGTRVHTHVHSLTHTEHVYIRRQYEQYVREQRTLTICPRVPSKCHGFESPPGRAPRRGARRGVGWGIEKRRRERSRVGTAARCQLGCRGPGGALPSVGLPAC